MPPTGVGDAGASLHDHKIEVERSRAKLTQDLAVLCSPETFAAFTDDLKQEAFDTRDAFWEKLKARAASNPAAVIAIGMGLAWRLIQRPPIASALCRSRDMPSRHPPFTVIPTIEIEPIDSPHCGAKAHVIRRSPDPVTQKARYAHSIVAAVARKPKSLF
jgi:hypothetical protein